MTSDEKGLGIVPKGILIGIGSIYVLGSLAIMLIFPILELGFGSAYRDQCPINPNIPVYLIVTGACGIATIGLAIVMIAAIICLIAKHDSLGASVAVGCIFSLAFLLILLMSFFLFIWFIVGNVWIFSVAKTVQHDDPNGANYCHRTLYQFAFWILIVSYIMMAISCCTSCCRNIASIKRAASKAPMQEQNVTQAYKPSGQF